MLTLAGSEELTDIVILFEVAGTGDAHVTELDTVHVITSLFASVEEV